MHEWIETFSAAITVCDRQGIILYMNERAAQIFERDGGRALIGKSLLDCHPEPARSKLQMMLDQALSNTYTIEKNGQRKIIHQAPWFQNGQYAGLVEWSFEIPDPMPHFIRKVES